MIHPASGLPVSPPSVSWWGAFKSGYQSTSGSVLKAYLMGGASAVSSVEAMPGWGRSPGQAARREADIAQALKSPGYAKQIGLKPWERFTTKGTRTVLRGAGEFVGRVAGPLMTTYRLGTEVNPFQQGIGGAASKTGRVLGEEIFGTAAFVGGMALGAKIGGGVGAALGSVIAPGAGTAIGGVVGVVAGAAIGFGGYLASEYVWNKVMDVAEVPFRAASSGWKYFREAGRRSSKLELGGGISRANRTQMAATMRQRALAQMNRSGINARSLLGMEGAYLHR